MTSIRSWTLFLLAICITALVSGCSANATPPYLAADLTRAAATRVVTPLSTRTLQVPTSDVTSSPPSTASPVSSRVPSPTVATPNTSPTPELLKLPPPLATVPFPSEAIAYSSDWHPDLRYPNQFILVGATSGVSPQGTKGFAAKLLYQGDPRSAADLLSTFFTSKGWQMVERTELDSKGFLLLFQKDGKQGTGAIVIDPDTQRRGYVKIVATVFP